MSDFQVDMTVDFAGLTLKNPVFTASGTCGYIDELADFFDIGLLGGFITKSITVRPRAGNPTPRIVETDAGMLNAIGLANLGLDAFVEKKLPLIENFDVPVFVNVAGWEVADYVQVVQRLAGEAKIAGFELNISCPNVKKGGITFGTDPALIEQITQEVKSAAGKKPLIVKLTPSVTDIVETAAAAIEGGADALSLINTFTAMVINLDTRKPVLANRTGGLSGPAIKPIAVYLINRVYEGIAKEKGVPILGLGGIRTGSDAAEFMIAGASVVSVGTATFIKPDAPFKVVQGLERFCRERGIARVKELTGSLQ